MKQIIEIVEDVYKRQRLFWYLYFSHKSFSSCPAGRKNISTAPKSPGLSAGAFRVCVVLQRCWRGIGCVGRILNRSS